MNSTNQSMEELENRYKKLAGDKIRIETQLENVKDQLKEHKATAKENWGTDDIAALEKKLEDIKVSNEKKRSSYQKKLDAIDSKLESIQNDQIPEEVIDDITF